MAHVGEFTCLKCRKHKREVVLPAGIKYSGWCADCRKKETARDRRIHLASLQGLTIEERITRIEEILYDSDFIEKIRMLEVRTVRY